MIDGICSHLTSVERVWSEIDSVVAMYGDESLNIVVTDAPLHPIEAFLRLQSTESSNRLEASASALVNDSLVPGGPSPLGVSVTLSLKIARGLPGLTMVTSPILSPLEWIVTCISVKAIFEHGQMLGISRSLSMVRCLVLVFRGIQSSSG
jgi:hypothetical protein